MDFASLMSKEISKSRPKAPAEEPSAKYKKRAEVEAEREAKYLAEQKALEAEKESKIAQKRKREEEEAEANRAREEKRRKLAEESRVRREEREAEEDRIRRKRLGLPELVKENSEEVEADDVEDEELVEKLRAMGEPSKLFGESHKQRLKRFRKLGIIMTTGPIPTSLELVDEKDMKVDTVPKDEEGKKYLFRQLASYFTMVLKEWECALDKEKRDTFASKSAYNAMVQSKENLTPASPPSHCDHSMLTSPSYFGNSKTLTSKMASLSPLSRLSRQHRSAVTWMQTMDTYD
jgi:pre-mRNA-splicing factor 18